MRLRNLLSVVLCLAAIVSCGKGEEKLFNGKNLKGWTVVAMPDSNGVEVNPFSAKDGKLCISGDPFGYIRTDKKYSDYTLHLEWRWAGDKAVDGGIFNRLQEGDVVWPFGMQCQMTPGDMGMLMGGIEIEGIEAPNGFYRKPRETDSSYEAAVGEWNVMDFVCKGTLLEVWMNGVKTNSAHISATEGYIGIQSEGGAMEFRNIVIRR